MNGHSGHPVVGEMIGPYRIERRIGGGGMGVVFAAHDVGLDREVALKLISSHLADDPEFRARFTREARAQGSLDSAHVVHVYAHGEVDGRLYIATQLVPDGDLGAMLEAHGSPPLPVGLDLIAQVAAGLADAHAAGLIHRDIKPANVLLRRGDRIRAYLADFGIARQVGGDQTRSSVGTIGTPSYMAPELHTGGTAGVASDVYSLGCLLWATLNGRAPYGGTSDFQVVSAHLEQPVPQLVGAGAQVDAVNRVLRIAMAKRPEERYPTAAAMRDDLLAAARLPSTAPPAPTAPQPAPPSPPRPRRRRRLAVLAAAAVLVIAAVGGTTYALTRGGDGGDEPAADPPPSSPSTSEPASPSTSSPPSTPTSPSTASGSDEKRATAAFAGALVDQGAMTEEQANCVAEGVVDDVGLDQLIDDGFFDQRMNFLNPDLADKPVIKASLTSVSLSCLT